MDVFLEAGSCSSQSNQEAEASLTSLCSVFQGPQKEEAQDINQMYNLHALIHSFSMYYLIYTFKFTYTHIMKCTQSMLKLIYNVYALE